MRAAALPSPLLTVPNVTAHLSMASVPLERIKGIIFAMMRYINGH